MNNAIQYLRRTGITLLLGAALAACGQPGSGAPSSGTAAPAARPTAVAGQPTTAPIPTSAAGALNPVLGFEPQAGGPGTAVTLWGSGVAPNAPVVIRLGFPAPTGEVLASATADAAGRWQATTIIPENLPSGERITQAFHLVVMDEANQPLASAPFGFIVGAEAPADPPPGPALEDAAQAVRDLLTVYTSGGDVRPYLADNLRAELDAGRPPFQVLGMVQPLEAGQWTVQEPEARGSEVLFVPATLHYAGYTEERVFTLVVDEGQWRINGGSLEQSAPSQSSLRYLWPAVVPADLTVQPGKLPVTQGGGWIMQLAVPHATTPDVVISGDLIGEAPGQKLDDVTVRGLPAVTYTFAGGAAVVWQEDTHTYMVSGSRPIAVLLEIAQGLEEIDQGVWQQRVQPQ
jgi:hypothetical protein